MATASLIAKGKAGLSKSQRHYLQDNGESDDLPKTDSHERKMVYDIKQKVQPTLVDTMLLLKHGDRVIMKNGTLKDYIREHHKEDLIRITEFINAILTPISD